MTHDGGMQPAAAEEHEARFARPEDEPRVYALVRALAEEVRGEPPTREEFASTFQRAFSPDGRLRFALVERAGRPIGLASLHVGFSTWRGRPTLEIHDDYVLPEERHGPAPARLLAFAEQHARAVGATRLECRARRRETEAIALYERHGFHDAAYVLFRKPLGPS